MIVKDNSDELGTHSGWVGSGYNLSPTASSTTWQHLVATFDGSATRFYIDGSYVGFLNASEGNNIYAVGNYQGEANASPNISMTSEFMALFLHPTKYQIFMEKEMEMYSP